MLWFIFSTTHKVKGHEYKIISPGRMYYNLVPYTKSEGKYTEDLIHIMVKERIEGEH